MATPQPDRETEHKDRFRDADEVREAPEKAEVTTFPERPGPSIVKLNRIINYAFVIVEGLIGLRVLLKVLGANPFNAFVQFIYTTTGVFVNGFLTVFRVAEVSTGLGVIEFGAVLAIGFYVLLNYAIV